MLRYPRGSTNNGGSIDQHFHVLLCQEWHYLRFPAEKRQDRRDVGISQRLLEQLCIYLERLVAYHLPLVSKAKLADQHGLPFRGQFIDSLNVAT